MVLRPRPERRRREIGEPHVGWAIWVMHSPRARQGAFVAEHEIRRAAEDSRAVRLYERRARAHERERLVRRIVHADVVAVVADVYSRLAQVVVQDDLAHGLHTAADGRAQEVHAPRHAAPVPHVPRISRTVESAALAAVGDERDLARLRVANRHLPVFGAHYGHPDRAVMADRDVLEAGDGALLCRRLHPADLRHCPRRDLEDRQRVAKPRRREVVFDRHPRILRDAEASVVLQQDRRQNDRAFLRAARHLERRAVPDNHLRERRRTGRVGDRPRAGERNRGRGRRRSAAPPRRIRKVACLRSVEDSVEARPQADPAIDGLRRIRQGSR